MKILVVEDDQNNSEIFKYRLKSLIKEKALFDSLDEKDVFYTGSGKESIKLCKKHDFDIVFMDICIEDMDGYEATKKIKKTKNVYMVAMTAYCLQHIEEKYLDAGFDDFLGKPIRNENLLNIIHTYYAKL